MARVPAVATHNISLPSNVAVLFLVWNAEGTFHVLKVEPPLELRIGFAVSHQIIAPDAKISGKGYVAHRPTHGTVKRSVRLVPRTDLYAGAAGRSSLVPDAH